MKDLTKGKPCTSCISGKSPAADVQPGRYPDRGKLS